MSGSLIAHIRVDKVDADELVAHEDLALFELRHWQVGLPFENLDSSGFLDEDSRHSFGNWRHGDREMGIVWYYRNGSIVT